MRWNWMPRALFAAAIFYSLIYFTRPNRLAKSSPTKPLGRHEGKRINGTLRRNCWATVQDHEVVNATDVRDVHIADARSNSGITTQVPR